MVAWVEVLIRMVDAPSVPIQGVIRRTGPVEPYMSYGGDIPPVYVNGVDDLRVWRDGPCVRVDTIDGKPLVRTDGEHSWRWAFGSEFPLLGSLDELSYYGPGSELLTNRPAGKWVGNKYAQLVNPVEEIEHLGRRCWSFELAPPSEQPHPMQMIVDQPTGVVLEQRNDGLGQTVSFVEFTAGIPIDAATFSWTGDIHTPDRPHEIDLRSAGIPSRAAQKQEALNWFRENVTSADLTARVPVELNVRGVQDHDETGRFEAWIGGGPVEGRLARRPRSAVPWHEFWIADAQTWSTPDHDWAIDLYGVTLDASALAELQQQLHPGVAVVGEPEIDDF